MKTTTTLFLLLLALMGWSQDSPALKAGGGLFFTGTGDMVGPMLRVDFEQPLGERFLISPGVRLFMAQELAEGNWYGAGRPKRYQSGAFDLWLGYKLVNRSNFNLHVLAVGSLARMSYRYQTGFTTVTQPDGTFERLPLPDEEVVDNALGGGAGFEANLIVGSWLLGLRPYLQVYANGDNLLGMALIVGVAP